MSHLTKFCFFAKDSLLWQKKHGRNIRLKSIVKSSPVTGLEWPRGFQEIKVTRFHDNGTGWW